jgi:hypothetical protein
MPCWHRRPRTSSSYSAPPSSTPAIASRFVNGYDNPPDFAEWFMDPGKAARYLAEISA